MSTSAAAWACFTDRIARAGFETVGLDLSATAVAKARQRFPKARFEVGGVADHDAIAALAPDVVVMTEVTWYVLDRLAAFRDFLRTRLADAFVLHMLVTYPPGVQEFGNDTFTDLEGIKSFFAMTYLEWGEVCLANAHRRTYFLGTWRRERLAEWTWSA